MGQYYKIINVEDRTVLEPHGFGDGAKLMEFSVGSNGVVSALALLLALDSKVKGPWAGKPIVVAGDYAEPGNFVPEDYADLSLYAFASGYYDEADPDELTEAGEQEEPPKRAKLPPFSDAQQDAWDAAAVRGLRLKLRRSPLDALADGPGLPFLHEKGRVFDQPEDLLAAFGVKPQERLEFVIEEMLRELRVTREPSDVSWWQVTDAKIEEAPRTGRARSLTVQFVDQRSGAKPPVTSTLAFPATANAVRRFLKVATKTKAKQMAKARAKQAQALRNNSNS